MPLANAPARPPGYRGAWITGSEASRLSSRVSGPFSVHASANASRNPSEHPSEHPQIWAAPVDADDLACALAAARALGLPIIPRGGGTGMPGGNLGAGLVLSLAEGFSEVGCVVEGRIRVGAGAIAADVERAARGAGFTLPPLPSSAPWATLGGMIANNAAGARSFGYGAMSAWVTALEGFRADGSFVRLEQDAPTHPNAPGTAPLPPGPVPVGPSFDDAALLLARWPEVRKNSSGYALDRFFAQKTHNPFPLMVGAEGTLLVLTAAELRLSPAAPVRGVHLLPVQSAAELGALAQQAPETGAVSCEFLGRRLLQVLAAVGDPIFMEGVLPAHGVALMLLEFEGQDPAHVEAGLARARSLGTQFSGGGFGTLDPEVGARLWGLRHRASPLIAEAAGEHLVSTQFIEDSVVPLPALGHYIEGVEAILADEETDAVIFGHAGDGNVHVNPLLDLRHPHAHARVRRILSRTVDLVSDLGGTLAGEHGDGRLRTPFAERIWGARRLAAFAQIKAHWDPEGRLNPGVKVPLFGQDPLEGFSPSHRRWPPSKSEGA